jgi:hypothetical protein
MISKMSAGTDYYAELNPVRSFTVSMNPQTSPFLAYYKLYVNFGYYFFFVPFKIELDVEEGNETVKQNVLSTNGEIIYKRLDSFLFIIILIDYLWYVKYSWDITSHKPNPAIF